MNIAYISNIWYYVYMQYTVNTKGDDFMEILNLIIWGIAFVVFVILEINTFQFVSTWFAVGSLAAFISAFFLPFGWQLAIFLIASTILLILTRPIVKKLTNRPVVPTNFEREVGKHAIVIEEINNDKEKGRVTLSGVNWMAKSLENEIISEGETVIVKEVSGAKLIVSKK